MKEDEVIKKIKDVLGACDVFAFMSEKIKLDARKHSNSKSKGKIDSKKKKNVKKNLQERLRGDLERAFKPIYPELKWDIEQPLNEGGDRADIRAIDSSNWEIIIEIDTARADQVAKKIVSRFYHILESPWQNKIYVALCYPGTKKMNSNECEKYVGYGEGILKSITLKNTQGKAFFINAFVKKDEASGEYKISVK